VHSNVKEIVEQYYNNYKNLMFSVAYKVLGNNTDAEDAVSEALIGICKLDTRLPVPTSHSAKILAIVLAERKAIDIYRKRKQYDQISIDEDSYLLDNMQIEYYDQRSHCDSSPLTEALNKLPPTYRNMLLLKYKCGFSVSDISKITNKTTDNVRKTILRAKNKLFKLINEK